jgi:hypothetical protein
MSYLMGWGDRYESHYYVGISAEAIIRALKDKYPGLRGSSTTAATSSPNDTNERHHTVKMESGAITLKDQLHEYMFRGEELTSMCLLSFVLDTYDAKASHHVEPDAGTRTRGRPSHLRVNYRDGFTRTGRCRVYRTTGHETLPHFMGGWFPRNDRPENRDLYCASILALLKPWSDLSELKRLDETFDHAFATFVNDAPGKTLDIIENIQYYYECYDGAKKRREEPSGTGTDCSIEFEEDERPEDLTSDSLNQSQEEVEVSELDIEMAHDSRGTMRERLYAEVALNTAFDCGIFSDTTLHTVFWPMAERAHTEDLKTYKAWEDRLKSVCRTEIEEGGPGLFRDSDGAAPALTAVDVAGGIELQPGEMPGEIATSPRAKRDLLKRDQRRAHDIIERQLLKHLAGKF